MPTNFTVTVGEIGLQYCRLFTFICRPGPKVGGISKFRF